MILDKKQLRQIFLQRRGELLTSKVSAASSKIVDYIVANEQLKSAKTVSCYNPLRNEVNLLSLLEFSPAKKIVFPRVVKGTKMLDFYSINSISDFEPGVFGLMEPKTKLQKIEISDIDLFLVPGLAFTQSGLRLGYGGGYYDGTLKYRKSSALILGICFNSQITDELPSEIWDIRMDFITTEIGTIKTLMV